MMKKCSALLVLVFVLLLNLSACATGAGGGATQLPETDAVLQGKLVQLYDGSCLLAGSGSSELYTVSTAIPIFDADSKQTDAAALKAGQTLEIAYSGQLLESYPMQLGSPAYIRITEQGDDLLGFYQGVVKDIWAVDAGLNPDSGVLAFDLSELTNLSDGEKSALVYTVSSSYGLQGVSGSFDELSAQGYIDKDKLFFFNGMLLTIKLTGAHDDSFTFDLRKWRSGTGALFFNACKAVKRGSDWTYTVGSQAIS